MVTWLFVLIRILANPVSNVFQKKLTQKNADPFFVIFVTHALLALLSLPALVNFDFTPSAGREFWINVTIAAALAVVGNALLVRALSTTDLSVLGPINAYKSVISLILGVFMIGEVPTPTGVVGVLLILAGSYFVVDTASDAGAARPRRNAFVQFYRNRGVKLRLAALLLSAIEAIFLKKALLASSPLATFVGWAILGWLIAALVAASAANGKLRSQIAVLKRSKQVYGWLAITTGLMQLTTLYTFGALPVGYALALFQMSTIVSVFLGYKYFREENILRRLCGSLVMIGGATLIVVFGVRR